jgi:hypothetical protein
MRSLTKGVATPNKRVFFQAMHQAGARDLIAQRAAEAEHAVTSPANSARAFTRHIPKASQYLSATWCSSDALALSSRFAQKHSPREMPG